MSIIKEFKEFALKGNVIDLAVGLVIGGAFTKIVTSLVQDIIMPLVGKLTGNINFTELNIVLTPAVIENGQELSPAIKIQLGIFLATIIDFALVAIAIFIVVKAINRARKKPADS